jgi:hypothetical protein
MQAQTTFSQLDRPPRRERRDVIQIQFRLRKDLPQY